MRNPRALATHPTHRGRRGSSSAQAALGRNFARRHSFFRGLLYAALLGVCVAGHAYPEVPYEDQALRYAPSVTEGDLAVGIAARGVVLRGPGSGLDLFVQSRYFRGGFHLFRQAGVRADGAPRLVLMSHASPAPQLLGRADFAVPGERRVFVRTADGIVMAVVGPDGDLRQREPLFDTGGEPLSLPEQPHWLYVFDLDGDGARDLLLGTNTETAYDPPPPVGFEPSRWPYDERGRWRGEPPVGHVFRLRNVGTNEQPRFAPAQMLTVNGRPLQVRGHASPAAGDFLGTGGWQLICCDHQDQALFYTPTANPTVFVSRGPVLTARGHRLFLPETLHVPDPVDWNRDGRTDILVGAENGGIYYLRNTGRARDGVPQFELVGRVQQTDPPLRLGITASPTSADWDGDGVADLLVGNGGGWVLLLKGAAAAEEPRFLPPTPLRAGGRLLRVLGGRSGSIQGPAEAKWGYTCPEAMDWNRDGLTDLLLGDITGYQSIFINRGAPGRPRLDAGQELTEDGRPLRLAWRAKPTAADVDGDGRPEYVCLDERARLVALDVDDSFRIIRRTLLRFEDGSPVKFYDPDRTGGRIGRVKLNICDWTGRGRNDLVVSTTAWTSIPPSGVPCHDIERSTVLLLPDVGDSAYPVFGAPRYVRFRSEPLRLGFHSCSAEPVDWNGDGTLDLVVGAEGGHLFYFRRDDLSWD